MSFWWHILYTTIGPHMFVLVYNVRQCHAWKLTVSCSAQVPNWKFDHSHPRGDVFSARKIKKKMASTIPNLCVKYWRVEFMKFQLPVGNLG